eukprot:scaffold4278_cov346-Prasinococcus_capsulatus_cf.AAC.2
MAPMPPVPGDSCACRSVGGGGAPDALAARFPFPPLHKTVRFRVGPSRDGCRRPGRVTGNRIVPEVSDCATVRLGVSKVEMALECTGPSRPRSLCKLAVDS